LVRKGRLEDAREQLKRLAVPGYYTEKKLDESIALMVHTNEIEKAEVAGTGFADCFRGTNRRRTEIVSEPSTPLTSAMCRVGHSVLLRQRDWRIFHFFPAAGRHERGRCFRRQSRTQLDVHCRHTNFLGM
jgi:hypothetical protein